MESVDEYSTTDLALAAYLHATDHHLLRLEGPPHKTRFVFTDVSATDVRQFYSGGLAPAQRLFSSIRELKAALHAEARR